MSSHQIKVVLAINMDCLAVTTNPHLNLDKNFFLKFMAAALPRLECVRSYYRYWQDPVFPSYPALIVCAECLELGIICCYSSFHVTVMFPKHFMWLSSHITWVRINRLEIRRLDLKWNLCIIFSNICLPRKKNYPRDN